MQLDTFTCDTKLHADTFTYINKLCAVRYFYICQYVPKGKGGGCIASGGYPLSITLGSVLLSAIYLKNQLADLKSLLEYNIRSMMKH